MGKKILVVDDEVEILETTSNILKKRGYEVLTASNGIKALAEIKITRPDLIMCDVLMPEMNGFTFYKELKNHPATSNIPVLIVTGRGKMEDSFKVVGVDGFITKPFSPQVLMAEIEKILSHEITPQAFVPQTKGNQTQKILAICVSYHVQQGMTVEAERAEFKIEVVASGADAISKAVLLSPDIIMVDILIKDMKADELIRILRRLPGLEEKPILGYCYYETSEFDDAQNRQNILQIHEMSKHVIHAGGTEYIGRYHEKIFVDAIKKYSKGHLHPDDE